MIMFMENFYIIFRSLLNFSLFSAVFHKFAMVLKYLLLFTKFHVIQYFGTTDFIISWIIVFVQNHQNCLYFKNLDVVFRSRLNRCHWLTAG